MEVAMEEGGESGCSSSTSIEEDIGCAWNNWAPVVDWGPFSVDDESHGFIESMVCDEIDDDDDDDDGTVAKVSATSHEPSPCHSIPSSTTKSAGTPPPWEKDDDKGLRQVHLLMAAADAMTGPNKSPDLARVILVRLKELAPAAAAAGRSNMERLAVHFTDALQGLLNGSAAGGGGVRHSAAHRDDQHHPVDALTAYQLLQDMAPYVKFGHFTANQAILEAVAGERRVHIVDYDIMEGVQWASLMQALVSAKDGTPPPHVRITAVTRGAGGGGGRRGMGMVQETGRRLVAFAASIGQPFSFGQCRLDPDERFRPAGMKVVRGEAVAVNCVLHAPHLPHRPAGSVASFLSGATVLGARVVTVVEEEAEAGEDGGFVGRFMDELHRYSAVWDSLEAGFPMQGNARGLVERLIMGPRIVGAVGRAYRRREGAEGEGRWGEWMAGLGFGRVAISSFNHYQARLLLGLFNEGYRVEEAAPNKLSLGWKSRRLLSTSVWSVPPPSPRSSPGDLIPSPEDCDYFS